MNRRRPHPDADLQRVAAFDDLYEATFAGVLAYCRRRTRSIQDAEEAVTETYLVAWRRIDDATTAESPLLWLYGVAAKVTANQRRGEDRIGRLIDRFGRLAGRRNVPGPDDATLTAADAADVVAALETLSSTDREIVRLVAYEQLSYAETGVAVGRSETAVRTRLYRARRHLHRHLDKIRRDDSSEPDTSTSEDPIQRPGDGRKEQP